MDLSYGLSAKLMDTKLKILYLPCHSILEYDQYRLWLELGHEVFSVGSYINPHQPHDNKRPAILEGKYYEHLVSVSDVYSKDNLCEDWVNWCDVIVVDHIDTWVSNNWEKIKNKKVVLRTIGQNTSANEFRIQPFREQGLKIVRYSPKEENISLYNGCDAMIRFCKDPEEYKDWNGNTSEVITMGQSVKKRGEFCNWDIFEQATEGLPRSIFGSENQDIPDWKGQLEYEQMKKTFRDYRCFFYTGTQPASYTLTLIETMMTGIPVVAIGKGLGNSLFNKEQDTYEVDSIIENGVSGFVSDDIPELREFVNRLLTDHKLAKEIGEAGRKRAIELFGKEKIMKEWEEFFKSL